MVERKNWKNCRRKVSFVWMFEQIHRNLKSFWVNFELNNFFNYLAVEFKFGVY